MALPQHDDVMMTTKQETTLVGQMPIMIYKLDLSSNNLEKLNIAMTDYKKILKDGGFSVSTSGPTKKKKSLNYTSTVSGTKTQL